jgi:hypothetical protein
MEQVDCFYFLIAVVDDFDFISKCFLDCVHPMSVDETWGYLLFLRWMARI